jgi:DNA-binding ferritin-like protein
MFCVETFMQLSLFVQGTLFNNHITALKKQCAKFQAIFDQVAERSMVFREFVKECEAHLNGEVSQAK